MVSCPSSPARSCSVKPFQVPPVIRLSAQHCDQLRAPVREAHAPASGSNSVTGTRGREAPVSCIASLGSTVRPSPVKADPFPSQWHCAPSSRVSVASDPSPAVRGAAIRSRAVLARGCAVRVPRFPAMLVQPVQASPAIRFCLPNTAFSGEAPFVHRPRPLQRFVVRPPASSGADAVRPCSRPRVQL